MPSAMGASSPVYRAAKRAGDVFVAGLLLLVLLPVLGGIVLAIVLRDGRPALYYQYRTGLGGHPFRFYKFRSMVRDADRLRDSLANEADGPIFKMRRDPRVTPLGRWLRRSSLDELPQLVNVLRGEMSLVGPRPLPVAEAARCTPAQQRRHLVPPGLLCLREVSGRSNLTFQQWMEADLVYVETRSPWLDLQILARAVPAVLRGDGAY